MRCRYHVFVWLLLSFFVFWLCVKLRRFLLIIMKHILKIEVQTPDKINQGKFKTLVRNSIELDSDLKFDYQKLVDGLRLLYSKQEIFINLTLCVL